jgi:hypothetical protein
LVEITRLCSLLKQRVSVELLEAADPQERSELLIAALYELSRSVLPLLGSPVRTREYLDRQAAVLDLVSFLCIGLIRGPEQARRGVAVLAEIGEGCQDPLLKKKFGIYAHELLAKCNSRQQQVQGKVKRRWLHWGVATLSAALLALYCSRPTPLPGGGSRELRSSVAAVPETDQSPASASFAPSAGRAAVERRERNEEPPKQAERPAAETASTPAPQEMSTRIRIVNSQVLVPVLLKNGAEAVLLELVLDTGATRTVIHDAVAGRLQIDLRQARQAFSEVADGRVIRSRIVKIDSLGVGPFAMAPAELELIAYNGTEGARDGLLGMDFLGKHRYQIDMEHELIRWF